MSDNFAYLSLGSNLPNSLGDSRTILQKAQEAIAALPSLRIEKASPIYKTNPQGYKEQDDFYNMALKLSCKKEWTPLSLLRACLDIENSFGRVRNPALDEGELRFGPRNLDIDLLLFGKENLLSQELSLPHPRMFERAFVLVPLVDIEPDMIFYHKGQEITLKELLSRLKYSLDGDHLVQ